MSKQLKATHEGELNVNGILLNVAVLENGQRIITQTAVFKAFGRPMRGSRYAADQEGGKLPALIDAKNLSSFISNELKQVIKPIKYTDLHGDQKEGYDSSILALVCEVYLDALKAHQISLAAKGKGVLLAKQVTNALEAEGLSRILMKISLIALIDEVTGYEKVKEADALQTFLRQFLENEKGKWVRTFPPEFFESIFKMKNWTWKQASTKKPQVIGHYINNYVYSRLAPKVLTELREKAPKDEKGNRRGKYPQWINPDFGHPILKERLNILTAFAKASGYNWAIWNRMVKRTFPKYADDGSVEQELDFGNDD